MIINVKVTKIYTFFMIESFRLRFLKKKYKKDRCYFTAEITGFTRLRNMRMAGLRFKGKILS